ncbi:hypothetical protein [Aeromicrobium phragmitis]|nr:hypothetical protein [Aeromicrobium phragmitis]
MLTLIGFYGLYLVIRLGVRDGIVAARNLGAADEVLPESRPTPGEES